MKKSFFKKKFLTFIGCFMALLFTACGSVGVQQSGVSTNSSVEPHVHTTQYTKGWEATCTKVGVLDYWYCSGCKTYFSDAECKNPISQSGMVLGKAPHTPVLHERKEPIGDIDGNIEYYTCEVCKNYYADKECTMKITEGQTLLCSPWKLCDSIIEVEEGRDIVVLQLSDTQIIDAAQKRYPERLPAESDAYLCSFRM